MLDQAGHTKIDGGVLQVGSFGEQHPRCGLHQPCCTWRLGEIVAEAEPGTLSHNNGHQLAGYLYDAGAG